MNVPQTFQQPTHSGFHASLPSLGTCVRAVPDLPFPAFADVEPERLAAEDADLHSPRDVLTGAWAAYLRRMLPANSAQDHAA